MPIEDDSLTIKDDQLCRVGEVHAQPPQFVDNPKVNGSLQIQQGIDAGLLHEVRQFELKGAFAEGLQVTAFL
jgi:hypothetical protein